MSAAFKKSEPGEIDHELRLQEALVDALREELERGPLSAKAARLRVQLSEESALLDEMRDKKPGMRKAS